MDTARTVLQDAISWSWGLAELSWARKRPLFIPDGVEKQKSKNQLWLFHDLCVVAKAQGHTKKPHNILKVGLD